MNSLVPLTALLTFHILITLVTPSPSPLTMKLVHYSSIHSPFFNPKATIQERFEIIFQMSINRLAYLREHIFAANFSTEDLETGLIGGPPHPLFMLSVEIGNPGRTQLLAMDTGSSLLWVYCGEGSTAPFFPTYIPYMSATYRNEINCAHYLCLDLGLYKTCNGNSPRCTYYLNYLSGKTTSGVLGQERFVFTSPNNTQNEVNDIVFGCSKNSGNDLPCNGILGLAPKQVSIVTQLGTPFFSYCLGNLSDQYYDHNVLTLGRSGKKFMEFTTPLFIDGVHYYVEIEAIEVGWERLDIDQKQLARAGYSGGAIIDSGAEISMLQEIAYKPFVEKVTQLLDPKLTRWTETTRSLSNDICYFGHMYRDLNEFPNVTLYYRGMEGVLLMREHLFKQRSKNVFCLTFVSSESHQADYSVIGANFQQFMLMEFDIEHRDLGISQLGCSDLNVSLWG